MAKPKCFYCDGLVFELVAIEILDCANPHKAIQCSECGCPVGIVPAQDVSLLMDEQAERQASFRVSIHSRLELIEARLTQLVEASQK